MQLQNLLYKTKHLSFFLVTIPILTTNINLHCLQYNTITNASLHSYYNKSSKTLMTDFANETD